MLTAGLSVSQDDQVCIKYCADVLGKQGITEKAMKNSTTN